jgi:hypothetical protein
MMWELCNSNTLAYNAASRRLSDFCQVDRKPIVGAMGISLNFIACAIFVIWMVEYFGYNAGNDIHILLLIAALLFGARLLLLLPLRKAVDEETLSQENR